MYESSKKNAAAAAQDIKEDVKDAVKDAVKA